MAAYSDTLAITTGMTQILLGGAGQEITVFGLAFFNNSGAQRTVNLRLWRQTDGAYVDTPIVLSIGDKWTFPKAIVLQPSDYLSFQANDTGVTLLYSWDVDTGTAPVLTSFTPRGDYSAAATYAVNDVVYVPAEGASYISLQNANLNKNPSANPAWWMKNASRGDPGAIANLAGLTSATITAQQLRDAASLPEFGFALSAAVLF